MNIRRASMAVFALLCAAATLAASIKLPEGPGANLVYARCQTCHDLQYVRDAKGLLPNQWRAVVASMKDYGLIIDGDEQKRITEYLATYLGPSPPPAAPVASADAQKSVVDGRAVFMQNCAACHGAAGRGVADSFPPLAGNPDLSKDRLFPVLVVLHGLSGPIVVEGKQFNGSMPPFDHLSDAEVAAVINFVRDTWSQSGKAAPQVITPAAVAAQRKREMTPAQVHAYRAEMS